MLNENKYKPSAGDCAAIAKLADSPAFAAFNAPLSRLASESAGLPPPCFASPSAPLVAKRPTFPVRCFAHSEPQVSRLCLTLRVQRSQVHRYRSEYDLRARSGITLYLLPGWELWFRSECEKRRIFNAISAFRSDGNTVRDLTEAEVFGKQPFPV